jgi:hypothetical protein
MLGVLTGIISLAFIAILTKYGGDMLIGSIKAHTTFPHLVRVPRCIVYAIIPLGGAMLFLQQIRILVSTVNSLVHGELAAKSKIFDDPRLLLPLYLVVIRVAIYILFQVNVIGGILFLLLLLLFGGGAHLFLSRNYRPDWLPLLWGRKFAHRSPSSSF